MIVKQMVYPDNFEEKTGFTMLRGMVADSCITNMGREWCGRMTFSSDYDAVCMELTRTSEMMRALGAPKPLPIAGLHDFTAHLRRLKAQGSYLDPEALMHLRDTLTAADALAIFFRRTEEGSDLPAYPEMSRVFAPMRSFPAVIAAISAVVGTNGAIYDSASPELASLRRQIQSVSSSMSGIMKRVMERSVSAGIVERDAAPSVRDGRLVVPVPAMMKRSLNGIVHDESATGKTVYIEPAEVVEANNRLRRLQEEEKREIIRILVQLADLMRPELDGLLDMMSILGQFDFIRAKALIGAKFDAAMPVMERKPQIDWYRAVHPALAMSLKAQGREAVPLNLRLTGQQRILVVSGPNAGGKSVTLKTVGIVQYMLQCGMLPTLHSNSHMSVFHDIMLDIGDEQSMENDLSTYSSHLRNMKHFLAAASRSSLILIDEMGSGTEPHFGGALAQSILSKLNDEGVMGIVTTHYQNLKSFADTTQGVVNGAMLYDRQRMQPLFQLSIGSPGSSFALEIARKTGLPHDVIEEAKQIAGSDYVDADKYMLDIARDRRYWSNKRLSIKEKEHKLEALIESYEKSMDELRQRRSSILADARRQASELLKDSNAALEKTILEIRKSQAEKERTKELRRELDEYKRNLTDTTEDPSIPELKLARHKTRKKNKENTATTKQREKDTPLTVGDTVRMEGGNTVGKVLEINGNKATVAFGALRTIVATAKLTKAQLPKTHQPATPNSMSSSSETYSQSRSRQLNFSRELDVRGMRVDEALQAVTYFLDDAVQFSAERVRILHGTGTGALRASIRDFLQTYQPVSQFHDEDVRFGGAGITVVHLD